VGGSGLGDVPGNLGSSFGNRWTACAGERWRVRAPRLGGSRLVPGLEVSIRRI
jgi:hypothetical protein